MTKRKATVAGDDGLCPQCLGKGVIRRRFKKPKPGFSTLHCSMCMGNGYFVAPARARGRE